MPSSPQPLEGVAGNTPDEFPLDAYSTPAPSQKTQPTTGSPAKLTSSMDRYGDICPESRWKWVRKAFTMVFKLWLCYLVSSDMARHLCFGTFVPARMLPPDLVCEKISPTTVQFWNKVFSKQEHIYSSPQSQILNIQTLLSLSRQRDFALRGTGASILHDFSSATFIPTIPKSRSVPSILPSVVLEEDMILGECWEFAGAQGRIGIRLSGKVDISSITLGYPRLNLLPPRMRQRAPRSITIWALVDMKSPPLDHPSDTRRAIELSTTGRLPNTISPESIFVPIMRTLYRPEGVHPVQPIAVISDRAFATEIIVVEVTSNWGASTTCLHHIGVHGDDLDSL